MSDLDKLKDRINAEDGFTRYNGISIVNVGEGFCECRMELGENGLNPHGIAHGGLLFTMCDTAAGIAASTTGRQVVSRASDIHYLRPGRPGTLIARGRLVHAGYQIALCAAEVRDGSGELLVTASFEIFFLGEHGLG